MSLRFVGPLVGQYQTILVDFPWPKAQGGGKSKRGADKHYKLMKLRDIQAVPIPQLAHPDGAHLWMWAIGNQLDDAFRLIDQYGAKLINCRPWVKAEEAWAVQKPDVLARRFYRPQRGGTGQYLDCDAEFLFFARFGKPMPYRTHGGKRIKPRQTLYAPRTSIHSQKPDKSREDIEIVSYGPRIELYARDVRPGWDVYGDAVAHCAAVQLVSDR